MWEIEFFVKENGRCPLEEFMNGLLPKKDLPYILNAMEQLEEHGYNLKRPQVDFIDDGIWELRVKTINGQFRLFYFFYDNRRIIITHGIKKKTGPVPQSDIKRAKEFRLVYLSRKEK
jgi:phage-related protein